MKKIEEKAKEYSQEFGSPELQEVSYNSFICGADTQKKIDEEEFHPIMEENVLKAIEKQKKIMEDRVCQDSVLNEIGKVCLDPTISCKTKGELMRIILKKAMEG